MCSGGCPGSGGHMVSSIRRTADAVKPRYGGQAMKPNDPFRKTFKQPTFKTQPRTTFGRSR